MCFYNEDYDWIATVCEVSTEITDKPTKCRECYHPIQAGEIVHRIHQQESESCKNCLDEDGDPVKCTCGNPNYGENFDTRQCDGCHKFLQAVDEAELAEGCPPGSRQPNTEMMIETISELGTADAERYFTTARTRFPELIENGYLGRLWKKMFPKEDH